MRIIGLDIHRVFAEAVALDNGELRRLGRIGMTRNHLEAFARTLCLTDHVVVEATNPEIQEGLAGADQAVVRVVGKGHLRRCRTRTWVAPGARSGQV
jgi:hypothetical protein